MERSNEALTFEFDWQPAEHTAVCQILISDTFGGRVWRRARGPLLVVAALVGLAVIAALVTGGAETFWALFPWILLVILWVVFFRSIVSKAQTRVALKQDPTVHYPYRHRLSDDGLTVTTGVGETTLKWAGMLEARETDRFYLFYYTKQCAHYLPKRAVPDDQRAALHKLLVRHVPFVEAA